MQGQARVQAGDRTTPSEARRYCTRCSPGLFRRINRRSLAERTILTWLGFFPWECVTCRRRRFFRDQGTGRPGETLTV